MPWQKIRLWLAIFGLLTLSISGLWGVDVEWRHAGDLATVFSTFMQTLYSVLGLVAIVFVWKRSRWARALLYAWALALLLTGCTAPIIWAHTGWWPAVFAASFCALCAGLVIWLAPLPPAAGPLRKGRWLVLGAVVLAGLVLASTLLRVVPVAVHGRKMESFCAGMRDHISLPELKKLSEQEGYIATPGQDAKGAFLKITSDDPSNTLGYSCEARFKPDGEIANMSFTAGAKSE
ncbi:MAG TPA: hypothetical protein VGN70_07275 [Gammaproteobacteria bacterium]